MKLCLGLCTLLLYLTATAQVQLSNVVGTGSPGFSNGPSGTATINNPVGMVEAPNGDFYFCDKLNHCIRKIDAATGMVSTFAGNGFAGLVNDTGTAAQFNTPFDIRIDPISGDFFVSDANNSLIRRITPAGVVSTFCGSSHGFADGTGTAAQFNRPYGIVFLSNGDLIVADRYNNAIRRVTPTGVVTTIAGTGSPGFINGQGTSARFNVPCYLALLPNEDILVTDRDNHCIRRVSNGTVSTYCGTGVGGFQDGDVTAAQMDWPHGLAADAQGRVYFMDRGNARLRVISNGQVYTLAGNGMNGSSTNPFLNCFNESQQVYVSSQGCGGLLISDEANNRILRVSFDHFSAYPAPLEESLCDTLQPADFTVQAPPYAGVTWGNGDSGDTLYNFSGTSMPVTIHYPGCDVLDTLNVTWISCGLAVDDLSNGASLGQNYPNPFSGNTSVPFELNSRAQVKFEVWSVLGYKVLEMDLGELNTGEHRVEFNAKDKNLPQGTYVYVLETSGSQGTSRNSRLMTVTR